MSKDNFINFLKDNIEDMIDDLASEFFENLSDLLSDKHN